MVFLNAVLLSSIALCSLKFTCIDTGNEFYNILLVLDPFFCYALAFNIQYLSTDLSK